MSVLLVVGGCCDGIYCDGVLICDDVIYCLWFFKSLEFVDCNGGLIYCVVFFFDGEKMEWEEGVMVKKENNEVKGKEGL